MSHLACFKVHEHCGALQRCVPEEGPLRERDTVEHERHLARENQVSGMRTRKPKRFAADVAVQMQCGATRKAPLRHYFIPN